jgi:DNA-binding FadR family transcriptional regulator
MNKAKQAESIQPRPLGSSSLLLKRARSANAFEDTVERILQTIRLGLVQPGDCLPGEREIAAMLGVSRDTVREATSSLSLAGYLTTKRGRYGGTFVADTLPAEYGKSNQINKAEITDILVFREVVECGAAHAAANAELSREIRVALQDAHEQTSGAKPDDYRRLDSRLHLLIAELTGSEKLIAEVAYSRMRVNELLDNIPLLPPNIAHSNEQHEKIISAILKGNPLAAQSAMRDHLAGSAALLRGFLG